MAAEYTVPVERIPFEFPVRASVTDVALVGNIRLAGLGERGGAIAGGFQRR
jgi:hypothetical protein